MSLAELQREAHAIAKGHGWWDEERTFGDCIALVHSKLSEVLEAYREHGLKDWRSHTYSNGFVDEHPQGEKPERVASELADVVIRVADMAEHDGVDLQGFRLTAGFVSWSRRESFGEWLGEAHWLLSQAFETFYADAKYNSGQHQVNQRLADIILWAELMAAHYSIDLDAAIAAKMEYNKSRPYLKDGDADNNKS